MAKRIEWKGMTSEAQEIAETILHMLDHKDSFFLGCYSKWALLSRIVTMLQALRTYACLDDTDTMQVTLWAMDELDAREEEALEKV